jgi:hypothetical protein
MVPNRRWRLILATLIPFALCLCTSCREQPRPEGIYLRLHSLHGGASVSLQALPRNGRRDTVRIRCSSDPGMHVLEIDVPTRECWAGDDVAAGPFPLTRESVMQWLAARGVAEYGVFADAIIHIVGRVSEGDNLWEAGAALEGVRVENVGARKE